MNRSKASQSKHDGLVRRTARLLKKQGWDVRAEVSGFKQPGAIGCFRPDVVGKKGIKRKIIEIETRDSVGSARDKKQRKAFKKVADRSKNTVYLRKVA